MLGRIREIAASSALKPKDGAQFYSRFPPAVATNLGAAPWVTVFSWGSPREALGGLGMEKVGHDQHLEPGGAPSSAPLTTSDTSPCSRQRSCVLF